ncbi:MAG: hypothetical protein IPM29_27695 [Planctomycetes bacterium]|nr:hypothetical protein [Planctomycetota bacterium]
MNPSSSVLLTIAIGASCLVIACVAFAATVWQRRRSAANATATGSAPARRLLSFTAALTGALLLAVGLCFHVFAIRDGALQLRDVLVVRARPDQARPVLAADLRGGIAAGETLVRFESPAKAAELDAIACELAAARHGLAELRERALDVDPKLARELARLDAEERALVQRRHSVEAALGFTEPQVRIELLAQRTRLNDVETELERIDGQLARLDVERAFAAEVAASQADLERRQLVAPLAARQVARDVETLAADSDRLRHERQRQEQLRVELTLGIDALTQALERHRAAVARELEQIVGELRDVTARRTGLAAAIEADTAGRMDAQRVAGIRRQELEIAALEARLEHGRRDLLVAAPLGGHVLYAHPSPGSARDGEPILAFGDPQAVRARIRVASADADRLADRGSAWLRADGEGFDEPRFVGTFLGAEPVGGEAGVAIAEFACAPGRAVFAGLLQAPRVGVRLDWAPPLWSDPTFLLGALLVGLALFLRVGGAALVRPRVRARVGHRAAVPAGGFLVPVLQSRGAAALGGPPQRNGGSGSLRATT